MSHPTDDPRLTKLDSLKNLGVDPYGARYETTGDIRDVLALFQEDQEEQPTVRVAGRITAMRKHGKTCFIDLRDVTGRIQLYLTAKELPKEQFELFKLLDIGDIVGVEGPLFKTRTGEITVLAKNLTVLSKALLGLPEKWHGLQDVERRYRQRYLDLIANPEVARLFLKRSQIIREIRRFLDERGYVEVETPMMQAVPGGASARPFITHHNALDIDLYLRISPELYLKRLLVGGMPKVYEINRNFRNEGISTRHNPEFTMLELYEAYGDYNTMMELTESLISSVAMLVNNSYQSTFMGEEIDLTPPWRRARYMDLIREHAGIDPRNEEQIHDWAKKAGIEGADSMHPHKLLDEIFEKAVQKSLLQPTFVLDYPVGICPLTKGCPDEPDLALRFELFVGGMELANSYSELNDPQEQEKRFRAQLELMDEGEVKTIDEDFLTAMKHGMPPAGGLGIGIDRLVMLITGADSIREVILFPLLRPM